METFKERLKQQVTQKASLLCVGLDTIEKRIPDFLKKEPNPQFVFNRAIIEATAELACCYKINLAFYSVHGARGIETLIETIACIHEKGVPIILDAKWGDIGHTAEFYARTAFETYAADAVTVNPYLGKESIIPFCAFPNKGIFILCFTSNASREDFQTLPVLQSDSSCLPLYRCVAEKIKDWNRNDNLAAVVGATAPEELSEIRSILGTEIPILCPGIGAQGGDLEEALWAGFSGPGSLIINVSRAILQAASGQDFAEAARREAEMFVDQMRDFLVQAHEGRHYL